MVLAGILTYTIRASRKRPIAARQGAPFVRPKAVPNVRRTDIEICRLPDGSDWLLASGSNGKVGSEFFWKRAGHNGTECIEFHPKANDVRGAHSQTGDRLVGS